MGRNKGRKRSRRGELTVQRSPQLFKAKAQKKSNKQQTKPLGTILLSNTKKDEIRTILNSIKLKNLFVCDSKLYEHVEDSMFKRTFLTVINESIDEKLMRMTPNIAADAFIDACLYDEFRSKQHNSYYLEMFNKRRQLPVYAIKSKILQAVNDNQVVVISGETGCGKTTQVAQFILDDFIANHKGSMCRIICTQPRRISAISVAERVADERAEDLGESVGYQIRLEKNLPRDRGAICFCTTGVALKLMEQDPSLSWVSHLILDEIHERDVLSDFILALIKKIITTRKDLKVILMSATLNSEKFSAYYNNAPHLNIPGFTYPVQEYYLEDVISRTNFFFDTCSDGQMREFSHFIDSHVRLLETKGKYSMHVCSQLRNPNSEKTDLNLILALLINICERERDPGAILVFLTGFKEISVLVQLMHKCGQFPRNKYHIFPLHSLMPTQDQRQAFRTPPVGTRKIIISTNIAETSITIDDVVFVIDCGKMKMSGFDAKTNTETLTASWVSLANANQRKGRAGRVKPGACFHLFSRARKAVLEQYQTPEILRKRLEDVILTAKVLQLGKVEPFFQQLVDSPCPESVALALNLLKRLNALTDDEQLTPLGYHLAKLPMAPQIGKMLLFGVVFSCLDPILSIAATLDFKDAFQLTVDLERQLIQRKLELANGTKSDHLLFCNALKAFERSGPHYRQFCQQFFLSDHTLKLLQGMKKQFMEHLHAMSFVRNCDFKSFEYNRNSHNVSAVKAVICAGLYPNLAFAKKLGKAPVWTPDLSRLSIHAKSVLSKSSGFDSNLLVYYRKVYSNRDYIHDGTLVRPLSVLLFGDNFTQIYEKDSTVLTVSNCNIKFGCAASTALIIKELKERFNWYFDHKISHPTPIMWGLEDETKILDVMIELITNEDRAAACDHQVYEDDS